MEDFKINIHCSTKRADIFKKFYATLQKTHLDPSKLFLITTDESLSMLVANQRLQGLMNKWRVEDNLSRVAFYCISKSLIADYLKMPLGTKVVMTTVNCI